MDNDDTNTQTKQSKNVVSQEQTPVNSAPMAYPDWASTFKAYYNTGKTPLHPGSYYTSAVASSPQAHPYMWPQHMISPYGTPPPTYVPVYSHGAMYTHAAMPSGPHPYGSFGVSLGGFEEAPTGTVTVTPEGEAKSSEGKSQSPQKNLKASLGGLIVLTNKANEGEKGPATNDTFSQSGGESGGEGSSDGSNYSSPNGSHSGQKTRFEKGSMEGEDSQNCNEIATYNSQNGHAQGAFGSQTTNTNSSPIVPGMPVSVPITTGLISGPATNLNIGMDFWSGTSATSGTSLRGKRPVTSSTAVVQQNLSALGSQELSIQVVDRDERELKRQRRKQSNRESARRSRLRKQAECEELQRQVGRLRDENDTLRQEVARIREENDKLTSENIRLTEQKQNRREAEFRESNGHKGTE